ncbi:MAG: glycosyltransferase family protein [Betaproteobacteria bacterium]|nr:glycosyltransferase family protein [Betaproteobacteria bacterium]
MTKSFIKAKNAAHSAEARFQQAHRLYDRGQFSKAKALLEEALKLQPAYYHAQLLLGLIADHANHLESAVELIERAISLQPEVAEGYFALGNTLRKLNKLHEASKNFAKAITLKPDYVDAYYNCGLVLQDLKEYAVALRCYDKAISLKPDFATAHNNRANVLKDLRQFDAALAGYSKAIMLSPDLAQAYCNRGIVFSDTGRFEDALADFDRSLSIKPDFAEAYSNRADTLRVLNRFQESLESYDKALSLNPNLAEARFNKSVLLLLLGNLADGWEAYEWRWKKLKIDLGSIGKPLWRGDVSIKDKTIYLFAEQGLGDTLQFCRYVKLVADLGAKVILQVQPPLVTLLKDLEGAWKICTAGDHIPPFDYYCPLLSLPLAFKTLTDTIPADIPYIKCPPEKSAFWKGRFEESGRLRVGIVWSGGYRPNEPDLWVVNERRNIPLAKFEPLNMPGIVFYSLQKGEEAVSQLRALKEASWQGPEIIDFSDEFNDFSDTMGFIDHLDLVIAVDTSTAHLAGAMGKPVWILNRFDTCWRWMLETTRTPWYPTATLIRQPAMGDWDSVIAMVRTKLGEYLHSRLDDASLARPV